MKKTLFIVALVLFMLIAAAGSYILLVQKSEPLTGLSKNTSIINLSNKELFTISAEIGEYINATELILDNNSLTGALPAEIGKMSNMEILSVKNNKLTAIPAEIGQLKNLKRLDFSNNNISTYPEELFLLQQKIFIDLAGNDFTLEQLSEIKNKMPNAVVNY